VPATIATAGRLYVYDVNATDPDGDGSLTYSLAQSPVGMTVDATTGRVEWKPTLAYVGSHQVEIQVTDKGATPASTTQTFLLSVDAPSLQKAIIPVVGGYDQRTRTLASNDCAASVQAVDDNCWETPTNSYTVYNFGSASIPPGAEIRSLVLCVPLRGTPVPRGQAGVESGTGWPERPGRLGHRECGRFRWQGEQGDDRLGLHECREEVRNGQLASVAGQNNCSTPQKRAFIDRIYLVVEWR
jgi:hypothetical protein